MTSNGRLGTGEPRQDVLSRLKGVKPGKNGHDWTALCPAHEDRKASLSVSVTGDGRVLLKCHAGCNTKSVVEALGLTLADLFPPTDTPTKRGTVVKTYDYRDEAGDLLFQTVRYDPKDFLQRQPDGKGGWRWNLRGVRRVLYNLPQIVTEPPDHPIFIVEGEKDADRLAEENILATTNPMGAGKWRDEYSQALAGRHVVILPDNDEPGVAHAGQVLQSLRGVAASVKVVPLPDLPPKGDVSDWLENGGTAMKLWQLVEEANAVGADEPKSEEPPPGPQQERQSGGLATTCLTSVHPEPIRWLVPGYFPLGKLILLAGDGGNGKSTLTLDLTADLSRALPCFGGDYEPVLPSETLLVSCEDDFGDTVVPRLLAAGADLSRVFRVDGVRGDDGKVQPFCLSYYDAIERELEARPNVRLVVIDPAGAFIGRSGVDDHKDTELRTLLGPLSELAARRRVTIVLVKHLNKGATLKAVHKVSGSAGYVNAVRAAFVVAPSEQDPELKLMLPLKFNLGPRPEGLSFRLEPLPPEDAGRVLSPFTDLAEEDRARLAGQLFRLRWCGAVPDDADTLLAGHGGKSGPKATALAEAITYLREELKSGEQLVCEVARRWEEAGHAKRYIFAAANALEKQMELLPGERPSPRGNRQLKTWRLVTPPPQTPVPDSVPPEINREPGTENQTAVPGS
jgi:hypothetical protein